MSQAEEDHRNYESMDDEALGRLARAVQDNHDEEARVARAVGFFVTLAVVMLVWVAVALLHSNEQSNTIGR